MSNKYSRTRGGSAVDHLFKVNAVASLGLVAASFGVRAHFNGTLPGGDYMTIAQVVLGLVIGVGHVGMQHKGISWWRFIAFLLFGLCAGSNVGTWIESALGDIGFCAGNGFWSVPDMDWLTSWLTAGSRGVPKGQCTALLVWQALALTATIYSCFLAGAVLSRGKRVAFWVYSWLSLAVWAMTFTYVLARFGMLSHEWFDLVYIRLGVLVYGVKVSLDARVIMDKYEEGDRDVVSHALTMMLNILHLFIRIIKILAKFKSKKS